METELGRPVVFLGPTLPLAEALAHLDATYLPPAEQGSVFRAVVDHAPSAIAIVDGAFARRPAVRHKEILWALSRGIPVFGASSMGALRAAELHPFGMVGIGLIYRWYRATLLADDDDVAVAMAPVEFGSQPVSDCLIDMRLTFKRALRLGVISRSTCEILVECARSTYFIDRRYDGVIESAREKIDGPMREELLRLEDFLGRGTINQKKYDAIELLKYLAAQDPRIHVLKPSIFHLTEAWAADLDAAGQWDAYVEFDDNLRRDE